jgi:putative oxygen-independent coproporphyrinogen III oxidase
MSGLYLHIPYCLSKCHYCDFFSTDRAPVPLADYVELLLEQLRRSATADIIAGPVQTLFFGGGTPSLLSPAQVGGILDVVSEFYGLAAQSEISLEANPGTVDQATLAGYRAAGVNRISLGLQSFSTSALALLGRRHVADEGRQAVVWARAAGFENIACDLMFGLPGQTAGQLDEELESLLALGAEHLSCYGLTVEERTPLAAMCRRGEVVLPDEERFADLYRQVDQRLTAAGYGHYEISNFARPGRECRHNLGYWQRRPYLGVGAGAHSFDARGWGERWAVPDDLERYRARLTAGLEPAEFLEALSRRQAMGETLYLGLRTACGVSDRSFRERFGCGLAEAFPEALPRLSGQLLSVDGCWRLTPAAWLLYDHLIQVFL